MIWRRLWNEVAVPIIAFLPFAGLLIFAEHCR
jgi:hypothetical protein